MALTDNLVSHWRFDEASGGAADAVGGNNLTNNNSATFATGKLFNGADLEASSSQFFSKTDTASLDITGDLTVGFWLKFESTPGTGVEQFFVSKYQASARSYAISLYNNAGTLEMYGYIGNGSTTATGKKVNWTPSTATWYYVTMVYTASAGSIAFYVNGSQQGSTVTGFPTSIGNGSADFQIGAGIGGNYFDGVIDEVSLWSRALTSTEVSQLYNSGSGMYFLDGEFVASADAKNQNLVSYWKLDESSGNAFDAHNSNDLTNNNTVVFGNTNPKINNYADLENTSTSSGTAQYFSIADNGILSLTSSFSFAGWVKTEAAPGTNVARTIFSKYVSTGNNRDYRLDYEDVGGTTKLTFYTSTDGSSVTSGSINQTLTPGTWYHIAVVYDAAADAELFVNGSSIGSVSAAASLHDGTSSFQLGGENNGADANQGLWDGLLDECGIWSRKLTSAEVTALYNSGTGIQYPFATAASSAIKDIISMGLLFPR